MLGALTRRRWVTVTALLTLLVGCTATPVTPSVTPTVVVADWTQRGPITWLAPQDPSGTLAADIADWNASHPNAPVQPEWLPEATTDWDGAIQAAVMRSDRRPTLVSVPTPLVAALVAKSAIVPLEKNDVTAIGNDARVLFYRTDLVAGTVPASMGALSGTCGRLPSGTSCFGTAVARGEGLTALVLEALRSAGTDVTDASGKDVLNVDQATTGLAALAHLVSSGAIAVEGRAWTEADAGKAFADGQLAFYEGWSSEAPTFDRGTSKVVGRVGVFVLPGFAGAAVPMLRPLNVAVVSGGVDQGTGADFIAWLNDPGRQAARAVSAGVGPVTASVYAQGSVRLRPALVAVGAELSTGRPLPSLVKYTDVSTALQDAGRTVLDGGNPADAAAALEARLKELLGR